MGGLEILGYIAAVVMGAVFGVIGSGASVLTMPILVYLMGFPPVIATAYSLVLVGTSAALGSIHYYRQGFIDASAVLFFGGPSILTAYLTRAWLMPILPNPILNSPIYISKNILIMAVFCILLAIAGSMLLWNDRVRAPKKKVYHPMGWIFLEGSVIGCITALVGAGGGFLIIPALVLFLGLPMKKAIGTSLLIIALKSLIGFLGDVQNGITLKEHVVLLLITATLIGMWAATQVAHLFDGEKLQRVFAYGLLILAAAIFIKEFL